MYGNLWTIPPLNAHCCLLYEAGLILLMVYAFYALLPT